MPGILEYIKENEHQLSEIVMNSISEYMYRNTRYDTDFSIVLIYSYNDIDIVALQKRLRLTDKIIELEENLYCVILDGASTESCIKAAENVNFHLLELNANNKYYLSAADSHMNNPKYINMIQSIFERLDFAIKNDLSNIVVHQDYVF